ncbi:MAG: DUF418 domain-containing protein [Phycisphaerae bacterium]|nr:DUF418 domain-containing protein [Phycisphaerae bacterium]
MADAPIALRSADLDEPLAPLPASERSIVMDALRGFAVLGILAMNIPGFALPEADFFDPRVGGYEGADRAVWWFERLAIEMKMQSIFSMLFGAGLVVLSERAARSGRSLAGLFYRRVTILAAMGLLHAYLLWHGDILWTYAVCGALIYPLRRLPNSWLLTLGILLFIIGALASSGVGAAIWFVRSNAESAQSLLDSGGVPDNLGKEMIETWHSMREDFAPTPEQLDAEARGNLGSFADVVAQRAETAFSLQLGIPFWMFSIWRFSGYMLVGIALMRWGVFSGALSSRAYAWMMAVGYVIGFPIVYFGARWSETTGFDFVFTFLTMWQGNYVGSAFVALGHIGALILLFRSPATGWIVRPLAATGRMALTNYLTQSLICALIFFGWGFGQWGRLTRTELAGVVVGIWTVQILWSMWWLARFRFGPMEWLWRTLTYGRAPEMR